MEFKPPKIPNDINKSKEHPLKDFIGLFFNAAFLLVGFYIIVFLLVQLTVAVVPRSFENKIAVYLSDQAKDNLKIQNLVQSLWQGAEPNEQIEFLVSTQKGDKNAFMAPGGFMILTSGLLDSLDSENELSFVICHELGHFYHRHPLTQLANNLVHISLGGLVSNSSPGLESAGRLTNLMRLKHSRSNETEADEFALSCLNKRYGHIQAFDHFFQKVSKESKLPKLLGYLSTHPISEERIQHLKAYALKLGLAEQGELTPWSN